MQQFVGIDWATRRARWCAVTPAGAVIDEGWTPADEDGLARLVRHLGPEALACMEMMWKQQFLDGGREGLAHGDRGASRPGARLRMAEEIDDLTRALGEAHVELRALKRGGPSGMSFR